MSYFEAISHFFRAASATQGAVVFADVDKTIGENCNSNAEGAIYPGMCELLVALSRGPDNNKPEPIQLLSARFPNRFFTCWEITDGSPVGRAVKKAGGKLGKRSYGLFWDQWRSVFRLWWKFNQNRYYYLAKRKMKNILKAFRKDRKQNRSGHRGYIFCGDDGEGDVIAATDMLVHQELRQKMRAVLIHEVAGGNAAKKRQRKERILKCAGRDKIVIFHKDVESAAGQALERELISQAGYNKVMKAIDPTYKPQSSHSSPTLHWHRSFLRPPPMTRVRASQADLVEVPDQLTERAGVPPRVGKVKRAVLLS